MKTLVSQVRLKPVKNLICQTNWEKKKWSQTTNTESSFQQKRENTKSFGESTDSYCFGTIHVCVVNLNSNWNMHRTEFYKF